MTKLLCSLTALLFFISCEKDSIESPQNQASKNLKEASSRLIDAKKWIIDEYKLNGELIYKQGTPNSKDFENTLEYVIFKEDGTMESYYKNEPTEYLKWTLDEKNNKFIISEPQYQNEEAEVWNIEAGSVYKNEFTMSTTYEETELDSSGKIKRVIYKVEIKLKTAI
ncbi:MAG: hypothetical protein ACRCVT_03045 [Leadbetterella sp.]